MSQNSELFHTRWNELYDQLHPEYVEADEVTAADCRRIAAEEAALQRYMGNATEKLLIEGKHTGGERDPLFPLPYSRPNRLGWIYHVVCVSDGTVFDPMLPQPMPMQQYLTAAFDQPIEVRRTAWTRQEYNLTPEALSGLAIRPKIQ